MSKAKTDPGLELDIDQADFQEAEEPTTPPAAAAPIGPQLVAAVTTNAPNCPSCGGPMEFVRHQAPPFAIYRCACGLRRSMLSPAAGRMSEILTRRRAMKPKG